MSKQTTLSQLRYLMRCGGEQQLTIEQALSQAFDAGAAPISELSRVYSALSDEMPPAPTGVSASECVKRLLRELNEYRNLAREKKQGVSTLGLLSQLKERGGAAGALGEAGILFESKGKDYNAGLKRDDYFPLGVASYAQMIHVKALRLVSFAGQPRGAVHEGLRDTALDIINYAAFLADWLLRTKAEAMVEKAPRYGGSGGGSR